VGPNPGARRPRSARAKAPPILFPVFDDNRLQVIEWVDQLEHGRGRALIPSLNEAHDRLRRVRKSPRHERLADFLHYAVVAIESGESKGARYILLTALATFGWPSRFANSSLNVRA
jgi:hypothetical protein